MIIDKGLLKCTQLSQFTQIVAARPIINNQLSLINTNEALQGIGVNLTE